MEPQVAKCPFCFKLYEIYSMYCGAQNCCPRCRFEAKKNMWNYPQQKDLSQPSILEQVDSITTNHTNWKLK